MRIAPGNGLHIDMNPWILLRKAGSQRLEVISFRAHRPHRQVSGIRVPSSSATATTGRQRRHQQRQ